MTPKEVLALAKAKDVKMVDLKFCDIHGAWQHFTVPVSQLGESLFAEGLAFDGHSIRGWEGMEVPDRLVVPDPTTAWMDPFSEMPTMSLLCEVEDPNTREPCERSPRAIARKAEQYLASTGIADRALFGAEPEFFVFDDVRFGGGMNEAFYHVDSPEGGWNTGREEFPNQGYKIQPGEGHLPTPPADRNVDLRAEMVAVMEELGLVVAVQHHGVATGGQSKIALKQDSLLKMADQLCTYKYVVRNVAFRRGKTATFMPKPLFGDAGSGMHTHQSLWKKQKPLMAGEGGANLSPLARHYIGGLLKHAPALCALTNPITNSYKRLVPGDEAPVILAYSARNRSAVCRIPSYSSDPGSIRVEYCCPDPAANPYLAFAALLMAGLDGVENQLDPGEALDREISHLSPEIAANVPTLPDSLQGAINALRGDHEFLRKGGVFSESFIQNYLESKAAEHEAIRLRPHPHEFIVSYHV